jgi:hypothetical protein
LVVVTSKSAPAGVSVFAPVASWLQGAGFDSGKGEIGFPRLSISMNEEMLGTLDGIGLRKARLASDSLKGVSPGSLTIARVVQKLELRVDEQGTEAAAATAVMASRSIAPPDPLIRMVVDKPFLFALRDQRTGLILFMGYVASPQKLTGKEAALGHWPSGRPILSTLLTKQGASQWPLCRVLPGLNLCSHQSLAKP